MFAKLKALSTKQKFLIGAVVVLVIYGLGHQSHPPRPRTDFDSFQPATGSRASYRPAERDEQIGKRGSGSDDPYYDVNNDSQGSSQELQQFQNEHAQIAQQAQSCMVAMNQAAGQMAMAAMNGQMTGQAPCSQYMGQWAARAAFLETEIYRLQTGDHRSSLQAITGTHGYQPGSSSNAPSYYRPSTDSNDGGLSAVERADRQGIRGTSIYAEEDGTQHELATSPYYFKNRETGQFVPSTSGTAPNDGYDYDPVAAQE